MPEVADLSRIRGLDMEERLSLKIRGIVQGVGFRPFVHKLVRDHGLRGYIRNCSSGVELELEGERVFNGKIHRVSLPEEVVGKLTDFHVHTNLAYCSENMTVPGALGMARLTGLKAVNFSEHSGQLYFVAEDYWKFQWTMNGRNRPDGCPERRRMPDYDALFAQAQATADDAEQTALYKEMEKNLTEHAANVYIQDLADLVAVRKGLEGVTFYPIYVLDLSGIHYTA